MTIATDLVKKMRVQTGLGMMDCKKYLVQAEGNYDKALEIFRKEGQKIASKKASRETNQGLIDSYIHPGNKIGVLIEVNCETDFVSSNDEFKQMVHDLAMHIAAFEPLYKSREEVPASALDKEREIYQEQMKAENKPQAMIDKIIEGKLKKYYEETCLLEQKFLKDDTKTVQEYIAATIAKIGENIQVKRFVRYSL